jgi:hypothetical protein
MLVLAGGIWWSNRAARQKADAPSPDAPPKLIAVAEADIQRIDLTRADGSTTTLRKGNDGGWQLTAPAAYPVDIEAVSSLVSTLANLTADKLVDAKAGDLAQFGLAKPALVATLTLKDGKVRRALFGDDTPAGQSAYAMIEGDARLFTVASYTKTGIDKTAADLRDKRLLRFDSDKVARVDIVAGRSETELGKNVQNEWQIVKPGPYRADG